ncbi:Cyclin-P3-1-like protein [Drosera capensis]
MKKIQSSHCEPLMGSEHEFQNMGAIDHDSDDMSSAIYHVLGLKGLEPGAPGTPRFLSLLASLLERSVQESEILLEKTQIKDVITAFDGIRAAPITIQQYMDRIYKYAGCSPSCFIVAYIYVDRYLQLADAHLTSLNVHRLLITSIMVAAKFIDDGFYRNAYYAKVGGVSKLEMNRLELKFLFSIDFKLRVTAETFKWYCLRLEKEAGASHIDRPIKACGMNEGWSTKEETSCSTKVTRCNVV